MGAASDHPEACPWGKDLVNKSRYKYPRLAVILLKGTEVGETQTTMGQSV